MLAREEHDADGAVPVEKGEQLGSALAVRSVERAEVVRDEAAGRSRRHVLVDNR